MVRYVQNAIRNNQHKTMRFEYGPQEGETAGRRYLILVSKDLVAREMQRHALDSERPAQGAHSE
jgi:hypothetical protein